MLVCYISCHQWTASPDSRLMDITGSAHYYDLIVFVQRASVLATVSEQLMYKRFLMMAGFENSQ